MSPRKHNLRNRKRIKTPRRFEDEDISTSSPPRQEPHEESKESSELEQEIYESPKPRKPKSKARAYRGEVTEFNPNLPPAAFPTLDHSDYVHNGGNTAFDLESHLSGSQSQKPRLAGSEAINPNFIGRGRHREQIDLTADHPTMTSTTAESRHRGSQNVLPTSSTVQKQPRASLSSSIYGEPTDNGPRNPIWVSNMARMKEAGRMSDLDRNILEMESSDEENAAVRSTKLARTASIPDFPAWNSLTVAHKLDLADAIAELYPDPAQVMHQLRLSLSQKTELVELLIQRQNRVAGEEANQQSLQKQTQDILLQGRHLSQSAFHQMVEENLYGTINEDDHLRTTLMELKKARAYLRYCGFDPELADSNWDVPSISDAASGTKPGPVQSKPKASLSSTAAQNSPSASKVPFSRRPTLVTPSQRASNPPDARLEPVQQRTQALLPGHRPTLVHALIAQHSPAAPLSKVPIQSYRVVPGSQSGDLRARYQSTSRIPPPTLPALPVQRNTLTGSDLRAFNNELLKARGASSVLPTPQEEHSSSVGSHSRAPQGLPPARRDQNRQSNGNPNVGASAPQETGGVMKNGDSVNKKKRKKSAT
ncbi:hypothetical protein HO173_011709 [Letharia columbiana]|uniref:Uncharacterized protein n=1 Tax=Letharia columbiana TaxID=112416 RepID=A0A8H6CRS9_9LECA|nr:uncharacterized protein HO173_011709 [Letharia columbiana]KAF6228690.1 hypothetical protein HO173_011709 [Letharia columbiana]